MKKILYFDTETTGLDAEKNDIIQLAYILTIGGKVVAKDTLEMQPFSYGNISQKALEIHGMQVEDIKKFQSPKIAYEKFIATLNKHINKYDKTDKFYPCGYNCSFDIDFVGSWVRKCGNKFGIGSYCNWKRIDPLSILYIMDLKGEINLPNYKLATVCEHFGITINAHDALSDIEATQKLIYRLSKECEMFSVKVMKGEKN
jgi:DNA polymerase-3 subunit epsilon